MLALLQGVNVRTRLLRSCQNAVATGLCLCRQRLEGISAGLQDCTHSALDQDVDAFCHAPELSTYQTLFIETSGGLMCPLNATQTWLDYILHAKAPVIFIVGLRLGCLNHALLTAHALKTHGVPCVGWIANQCDPNMQAISENIQTLEKKLPYKRLATIAFNGTIAHEEWILAH